MHTLLSIDSPGRSDKHFYLYYESLFKPRQLGLSTSPEFLLHARSRINVSRVSLACLYSLLNQSAEEAYRFYVLAFNSHTKKDIIYIHQLDLQVNVL
jgi:hypothetical protein